MTFAPVNSLKRKVARNTVIADATPVINVSLSYNQGDLLILNSSTHLLALPVAESDGANFVGISPVTIQNGKVASALTFDNATASCSIPGPEYGDEHEVILSSGQTVHAGDSVYLDPTNGTRNVQASGSNIIGTYTGAEGASVTGATGGSPITCKIFSRYPGNTLKG